MPDENRVKTYTAYPAANSEVEASELNALQDKITWLDAAENEVAGLPTYDYDGATGFAGATILYNEQTVTQNTDEVIDNSRDWRDRQALMFCCRVTNQNELPSGANHNWSNIDELSWTHFNTQDGIAIGGPFAANEPWWQPFAGWNLYIYADSTNGYLYVSDDDNVADRYIYYMFLLTDVTE